MTTAVDTKAREVVGGKSSGQRYRKRDLVYYTWPPNTCYIHLQQECPAGVMLDLEHGTWTYNGTTYPIGAYRQRNFDYDERTGSPVAVYDRTKFKHLEAMVRTERWVADRHRPPGD